MLSSGLWESLSQGKVGSRALSRLVLAPGTAEPAPQCQGPCGHRKTLQESREDGVGSPGLGRGAARSSVRWDLLKRMGTRYRNSFLLAPCCVLTLATQQRKNKAFNLRGLPRFVNLALRQESGEEWPVGSQKPDNKTLLFASPSAVLLPLVSASAKVS